MTIAEKNGVLPQNIRQLIDERGMKHIAVAKRAGLSGQQLSDMLSSRRLIKISDVQNIAKVLDVPIASLYEEPENPKK